MDYPSNVITAQTQNEDHTFKVTINVRSEYAPVDEAALTRVVQQWILDNVPETISTTAQRWEQVFPVTDLPPLDR